MDSVKSIGTCCHTYLDHETSKGSFRFSNQAATCYYQSNHSKVARHPVKCLVQGHNKRTCRLKANQLFQYFGMIRRRNRTHVYRQPLDHAPGTIDFDT